ncbi:MAG: AAA family ATPase [Methylococcales bacterium]|nr:AAA family ATPase [Methylococcales bacterium]
MVGNGSGSELIHALLRADAYPHEVAAVSLIETHISWVLLTGTYAYKIKKPVNFGFLDFSTLERRRFFCQEELRLNRRLAADLYLDVLPITGTPEKPSIGGDGEAIEYAVKMLQFPAACTLSELAEGRQLSAADCDQIADIIANFHEIVARTDHSSDYGDSRCIRHWFVENFTALRPLVPDDQQGQLLALEQWGDAKWQRKADFMQLRKQQGHVRECHGDLHLSNMTLINGKVTLFDCIEFNPKLRWVDVISEIAFLFVDLVYFDYEAYAYRILNRYLQHTGDYQGLVLLRYYLVYRALVCAKVSLLRQVQQGQVTAPDPKYLAFANLAARFSQAHKVALIITHGVSGSGKSTYAKALAEKLGAVHIRSDIERKRLFGFQAQQQTGSGLGSGLYAPQASDDTYQHLLGCAQTVLEAGFTAIIDATFLKSAQRQAFLQLAHEYGVAFIIIDFLASDDTLDSRVSQRQNDASEATLDVLQHQRHTAQPLSAEEQPFVLAVDTESGQAMESLVAHIEVCLSAHA